MILEPLALWRILSINDLFEQSAYSKSRAAFYKIIQKLERLNLIESFQNCWNNEKYVYLLHEGLALLGHSKATLPINKDLRFHDSLTSRIGLVFDKLPIIKSVLVDQNISNIYPNISKIPDLLIEAESKKEFRIAIEVEVSQKSSTRIKSIFENYGESDLFNIVIYITDKKFIFNAYQKILREIESRINKDKFVFCYDPNLHRDSTSFLDAQTTYKGTLTSLRSLIGV